MGKPHPGICVSPQCELGKDDRAPFLVFCPLLGLEFFAVVQLHHYGFSPKEVNGDSPLDEEKQKKVNKFYKNNLIDYLKNKAYRYYFLMGNDGNIPDSIIDFQITECLSAEQMKDKKKIGVLKSPWREEVPSKYGSYISRIGTARIPETLIKEKRDSIDIAIFKTLRGR